MTTFQVPELPPELIETVASLELIPMGPGNADYILKRWRAVIMKRVQEKQRQFDAESGDDRG